jgi:hypothetical protein
MEKPALWKGWLFHFLKMILVYSAGYSIGASTFFLRAKDERCMA